MKHASNLFSQYRIVIIFLAVLSSLVFFIGAAHAEKKSAGHGASKASLLAECHGPSALPSVHCGRSPSIAMDEQGKAYVVFSQHGHVYLATTQDFGKTYTDPIAVNARPEAIYDDGENRPKIVLGNNKQLFISWTHKTPGRYSGDVRFARSLNAGKSFSEPVTINSDKQLISHRFDAMVRDASGRLYLFWIDKRDKEEAVNAKQDYQGAAIYYRYSDDHGETFQSDRKWVDHSCECCRLATAVDAQGNVALLWRHVFPGNIRDHAIAYVGDDQGSIPVFPNRAAADNWHLEGCPHQGPDLSFDANHQAHMVWFTQGELNKGLVYGQYDFRKKSAALVRSIDSSPSASRPQVQVMGREVYIVWKRFNGEAIDLLLMRSTDSGKSWLAEEKIASTSHDSDHPDLIRHGEKLFVTWHTQAEGLLWKELK